MDAEQIRIISLQKFTGTDGYMVIDNTSGTRKILMSTLLQPLDGKVDKVDGKELSSNDFSDEDKEKLNRISATVDGDTLVLDV